MHLISALLFGISANIDTLIVGFSYGIKKQRIPLGLNMIISVITFLGTLLSIGIGIKIAAFIPLQAAKLSGSVLLILLGVYYVLKYIYQKLTARPDNTTSLEALSETVLTSREAAALGAILTINNAGMGIGASFAGIHFLLTSILTLILSAAFLFAGNRIGTRWRPGFLNKTADLLSGLIIIALGVYELVL